jgi:leucyl-tRNA---protein transferase
MGHGDVVMNDAHKPRTLRPPRSLPSLGRLVVLDGECAYFPDEHRTSTTAYAVPGPLSPTDYDAAMSLGMRRSGTVVYRPLCHRCRRCQPFRVDVARFEMSRSQRRIDKRNDGRFVVTIDRPVVDDEHLSLYERYQHQQHNKDDQATDVDGYARFLCDTIADTRELTWRDATGALVGVGIIDVVPTGISSVYFYWEPSLASHSLGVYSALFEIDLCRRWQLPYYYLGYLVPLSKTMSYKAQFAGGELWHGDRWLPVMGRGGDVELQQDLQAAERAAVVHDATIFGAPQTELPTRGTSAPSDPEPLP